MWTPLRIDFDIGRHSDVSPTDKVGHGDMLYQGADFDFEFAVTIDGVPIDYSGCSFELLIFERGKKEPFFKTSTVQGSVNGVVMGGISASKSALWGLATTRSLGTTPYADCSYEINCTRQNGRIERLSEGVLVVSLRG